MNEKSENVTSLKSLVEDELVGVEGAQVFNLVKGLGYLRLHNHSSFTFGFCVVFGI